MNDRQNIERRRVLISSVGLLAGTLLNASMDGVAAAAEFADSAFLLFPVISVCSVACTLT